MCQVTPFTYPCCRRIYVLVEKLPNCPADWPRSKCPQELCIQVIDTETAEPKHSSTGVCWRCTAVADGKAGADRESLRPEIDKAVIVEGLEELDVSERKQRAEGNGSCWYCGARQGCSNCGTNKSNQSEPAPDDSSPIPLSKKRQVGDARRPRKKSKGDGGMGRPSHLRTLPPIGGLSQPAFNVPGQISRAAQFLPQRKPRGTPFGFQNQNISPLAPISEVSAGMWQTGIPSTGPAPTTGYPAFWQNFNNNAPGPSSAAGRIQAPQNMDYQMGLNYHSPGIGMELDSGSGGYNPLGLSQQNTLSGFILTVCRWLWTISPILMILPCFPRWERISAPLPAVKDQLNRERHIKRIRLHNSKKAILIQLLHQRNKEIHQRGTGGSIPLNILHWAS